MNLSDSPGALKQTKLFRLAGQELENSELLGVLNKWPDEPACGRLAMIIELIQQLDRSGFSLKGLMTVQDWDRYRVKGLRQLNTLLNRYRMAPGLVCETDGTWELGWLDCDAKTDSERWEAKTALWIAGLASSGLLTRVRHCRNCSKWFYAHTEHQSHCSESCRKKFSASSPIFKAKRARYMREQYRPSQKQQDENSLARVAKKFKKTGN